VPWLCYLSVIGNTAGSAAAQKLKRQRAQGCIAGTKSLREPFFRPARSAVLKGNQEVAMNAIIYLVGLVVIVLFILSFIGLR